MEVVYVRRDSDLWTEYDCLPRIEDVANYSKLSDKADPLSRASSGFRPLKKLRHADAKCRCDTLDVDKADISRATFDI